MSVADTTARPRLIDAQAVARLLGVSRRTVWRLAETRQIPSPIRLGTLRRWDVVTIERYLDQQREVVAL